MPDTKTQTQTLAKAEELYTRLRQCKAALVWGGVGGWQTLWDFGGVNLRSKGVLDSKIGSANGDWQAFAEHLPLAHTHER